MINSAMITTKVSRHGSSILVLVLKSALSTFFKCLNIFGTLEVIKGLVPMIVLEHFL